MGEVIKRVLAKENLARTTAVVTQLRAEHNIATQKKKKSRLCIETGFQRSCITGVCD